MNKVDESQVNFALDKLSIEPGNLIFLTAGFGAIQVFDSREELEDLFLLVTSALSARIEGGALIVPTYTYSFSDDFNKSVYNVQESESKLGLFSNWFLNNFGKKRTDDPMISCSFSNIDIGNDFNLNLTSSYGSNSLFDKLLIADQQVKILNLGLGVKWMPFIHYLDFVCQSKYRYHKTFQGKLIDLEVEKDLTWEYHVAVRHPSTIGSGEKNGLAARDLGLWQFSQLGLTDIYMIDYHKYFEFSKARTIEDPWNLVTGPPLPDSDLNLLLKHERK
jgi:aminoglycoside N3'-acetyltransferase